MATASSSGIIILDDDDDDDGMSEEPGPSGAAGNQPPTPPQANGDPGQKPTITGKDPASLKAENQRLFTEFLEFCSQHTQEHSEVIPFLDSRHQKTSPDFLASAEFRNVLGRCLTRVQAKRSKVYVYINELCTVLKAHSQKKKLALSSTPQQSQPPTQPPDSTTDPATAALQPEAPKARAGSKRQICYLENLLRVYVAEIQRLQERELDLSELDSEDSAYLQESRLKRRMMRIFERLCELKACSSLTGRVIEQRIPYRGTRYPEVNRRIERFINRPDVFPDYNDILKVIQKASACHELGLPKRQMQSMAADAFREVGNRLQERRHLDLVYNFGSHLTDQYQPGTDPALADAQLSRRLRHNRVVAMNRLNEVISRYAHLQDESEEEEWRRKRAAKSQGSSSDPHLPGGQAAVSKEPSPVQKDKEGSPSVGGAQQSASEEEDEDEASSETDIEAELQESKEGGEEEEEPMQGRTPGFSGRGGGASGLERGEAG
uniref:Death domain-associated protein 6 n=1 Tax=Sphenodon punctatus TaxID=8508 RepID=A0A8D0HNZ2_SPHPU